MPANYNVGRKRLANRNKRNGKKVAKEDLVANAIDAVENKNANNIVSSHQVRARKSNPSAVVALSAKKMKKLRKRVFVKDGEKVFIRKGSGAMQLD